MAWLRQALAVLGAIVAIALVPSIASAHGGHRHAVPPATIATPVSLPQLHPEGVKAPVLLQMAAGEVTSNCQPAHHGTGDGGGCCHGSTCSASGCGATALVLPDSPLVPDVDASTTPPRDGLLAAGRGLRPPDHPPKRRI